jgi:hypothetical protein
MTTLSRGHPVASSGLPGRDQELRAARPGRSGGSGDPAAVTQHHDWALERPSVVPSANQRTSAQEARQVQNTFQTATP